MDSHENKKYDIPAKPQAGANDPKGKQKLLDKTPHGRHRPPNTEDELDCGTENKTAPEKARVEQGHKGHRKNTN
jgi:hypothetical protein